MTRQTLASLRTRFQHAAVKRVRIRYAAPATIFCLLTNSSAYAALPAAELQALKDIYNASGGPTWSSITDWASARNAAPTPVCSAAGGSISCDAGATHVIGINLYNNNLIGSLPASLSSLSQLQTLQVGYNQLSGTLPPINALSQLQTVDAYSNQFTGALPSFSGLSQLVEFNFAGNHFSGPLPALTALPRLLTINIGYNEFTGTLPTLSGAQLPLLNYLEVDHNQFSGSIPDLSSMTALTAFYAGSNRFTGRAPAPPSPSILVASASTLCPNTLAATASAVWDAATQQTPWYEDCDTDTIFVDGME